MKRELLIVFLCVSLTGTVLQGQTLEKGIWCLQQKQFISAKRAFESLLHINPANARALYYLGQSYYALNKLDSADYYFQQGMLADPKEPYNYLGAGKILLNKSDKVNWFKMYEKGRKLSSDPFTYNLEAADACLSATTMNYDLVAKYLDEAQLDSDKDPQLYIGYGNLYLLSKSPGDAINSYQRAIYYDKKCVVAYLKLGEIYTKANYFKDGLNAFNTALEIDSSQIIGYKMRGDMFYNVAKYQEAEKDYTIYMQRSDRTIEEQEKYVFILFFAKDYERAMELIDLLLQSNPELTILYRIKAYIDYETGKYPEGLENLETFFEKHDTSRFIAQDYAYYGRLLIKSNQDSLGTIQLVKALVMDSSKVELYDDLARSYSRQKKFQQSNDAYKKMLVTDPANHQNIFYQIGRNYYFMAEDTLAGYDSLQRISYYNQADSNFKLVTELSPESYVGFIWRGRVHSRLDPETSIGLAKPDYEQALAIIEKGDASKTPKLLIECCRYLAFYYYLEADKLKPTEPEQAQFNMDNSLNYWEKILALDPADTQAKTALENLKAN
jgi:tetratricopeptide (TPR) repeat protein